MLRARDSLSYAQARMCKTADAKRHAEAFEVGEFALLSTKGLKLSPLATKKLLNKWLGPFEVIKRVVEVAYELSLPASMSRIHPVSHVSLLRKYNRVSSPPSAVLLDGEEECEIQQVLSHRDRSRGKQKKRQPEYFMSWEGMGPEHSEWLRDSDLTNAAELVQDYLDTLEPQDRPAARVGRPTPSTASESQVIPGGTTGAKVPAKRGRPRKQSASVDATMQDADAPRRPCGQPRKHS